MTERAGAAELNRFLAGVEQSAFHLARHAVRDTEEALDIVQDAMMTLARKYARRPADEWRPLFFRILQNRIRDWHRRAAVRRRLFSEPVVGDIDHIERAGDDGRGNPLAQAMGDGTGHAVGQAVQALPVRQQQAFLLRAVEGMNVAETATAMGCSEGSVKTHYSRALGALRKALEEHL
ncbi:MAG: RNA polymerase sigma factor [Pseudomonadales bacterium]|jgi:RNA polymerase sigma-70 factor (ECF subfamily)